MQTKNKAKNYICLFC